MQGINFIFAIAVLIMSVVVHEVSHGYSAEALGDPTAKYAGRLTLNPLNHLDLFGSVIVPFLTYVAGGFIFGWAKPVPYNPYNLKNQKWGPAIVAVSGPLANFLVAGFFGLISVFIPLASSAKSVIAMDTIRFGLQSGNFLASLFSFLMLVIFINIILGVFNLVPIPPLDGSKVLFALLPYKWRNAQIFLEKYGFIILLIFIFYFFQLLFPIVLGLFKLFTGIAF